MHWHRGGAGQNLITGYGDGFVMVNGERYPTGVLVLPGLIETGPWAGLGFSGLNEQHFQHLCALAPEVVLLGTGPALRFPHPRLSACLLQGHIGLEVMDSGAACRTYHVLLEEGRRVAVLLLAG